MKVGLLGAAFAALALMSACQSDRAIAPAPAALSFARAQHIAAVDAAGFAFSADGATLLVSSDASGTMNAYAQPVAGGAPRQLTASFDLAMNAVSYFPSDNRILVSSARAGGARKLFVRAADGALHDLSAGESTLRFLGWRQDGSAFWAAASQGGGATLYSYDATSLERRTLFQHDSASIGAISRDGRWLALVQRNGAADSDVLLVNLTAPTPTAQNITAHAGAIQYDTFEFTSNGRALTYATNEHGAVQAWRYDLASAEKTPVMEAQADVLSVITSPSGAYRIFVTDADTAVIDQHNDRALPLSQDIRDVRFNRDETRIAFRLANDPWPQDIFLSDVDGGHITRLVHSEAARR